MKQFFLFLIKIYRYVFSPLLGKNCRFYPSCSEYSKQAIEKHGVLKGSALALLRICNCHPYSKRSFIDHVPEQIAWREIIRYKKHVHAENRKNH